MKKHFAIWMLAIALTACGDNESETGSAGSTPGSTALGTGSGNAASNSSPAQGAVTNEGASLTPTQKSNVGKALTSTGKLVNLVNQKSSGGMPGGTPGGTNDRLDMNARAAIRDFADRSQGQRWLARFSAESGATTAPTEPTQPEMPCYASTYSDSAVTCTSSCEKNKILASCSTTETKTFTCKNEEYSWSEGKFSYFMDFTGLKYLRDQKGKTEVQGSIFFGMDFSGRMKGPELDGLMQCNYSLSMDMAQLQSDQGQAPEVDCSNFSCSYNGVAISCEDMKKSMSENSCEDPAPQPSSMPSPGSDDEEDDWS